MNDERCFRKCCSVHLKIAYSPVPNNKGRREGLNKKGVPTDNLNINKRGKGVQIKGRGGLKIVFVQKWQPFSTNYGDCVG